MEIDCLMPRRPRRAASSVANPNLTPLLDVVLQLITFFMMLVHFGTRMEGSTRLVRLPLAPAALPGSDLTFDRLSVILDAEGRLRVGGRSLNEADAGAWWAQQARSRRSGLETLGGRGAAAESLPTVVILRADRAVSYGAVRRTLVAAQEQGFAHFSLVVLRRPTP
jgi:biopolymer transport protein ExbD